MKDADLINKYNGLQSHIGVVEFKPALIALTFQTPSTPAKIDPFWFDFPVKGNPTCRLSKLPGIISNQNGVGMNQIRLRAGGSTPCTGKYGPCIFNPDPRRVKCTFCAGKYGLCLFIPGSGGINRTPCAFKPVSVIPKFNPRH